MKLNDREWCVFLIGDLFSVKRPPARNKDNYEVGDIPFVASGSVNNGVMKCCKPLEDEKLDEAGCITVSPVDGSAFYQPYPFLGRGGAGSSILMLYADNMNLYSGQFIAKMISNTCACKYTYGHMGNKDGIKRERIMLPIDENNNPDYQFMEDYVKELMTRKREQYLDYCKEQLKIFGGGYSLIPLADKHWKSFFIGEIFDYFVPGKSKGLNHLTEDVVSGKSYIGATNRNNGVLSFVQEDKKLIQKGNAIGFIKNGNGSAGYAIYKYESFISTSDVIFAYANWLNKYIGLFIITCSDMSQEKYSHGYKWTKERLLKSGIMLPVNEYGIPDYEYMEKYSKNLLCEKIQRYIKYIENK
ncbi:hypothetical protein DW050_05855 [Ruminococcus sp. AF42-10]|nr:restriction endonuclease subunit S [Ruminococcus sp. AF42-10]RGF40524.1 hypothetical protein DW050_05855 [Ruminococcus sp. AF42-10]